MLVYEKNNFFPNQFIIMKCFLWDVMDDLDCKFKGWFTRRTVLFFMKLISIKRIRIFQIFDNIKNVLVE